MRLISNPLTRHHAQRNAERRTLSGRFKSLTYFQNKQPAQHSLGARGASELIRASAIQFFASFSARALLSGRPYELRCSFTRRCRGVRGSCECINIYAKRAGAFARRGIVSLCDKVAGRFSQVAASSVMKFLSLARRNVLKTGKSFAASNEWRKAEAGGSEQARESERFKRRENLSAKEDRPLRKYEPLRPIATDFQRLFNLFSPR